MSNDKLQLFEDQPIRTAWDEENEEWYFSIVDVIRVLTDQPDTRHAAKYWSAVQDVAGPGRQGTHGGND